MSFLTRKNVKRTSDTLMNGEIVSGSDGAQISSNPALTDAGCAGEVVKLKRRHVIAIHPAQSALLKFVSRAVEFLRPGNGKRGTVHEREALV